MSQPLRATVQAEIAPDVARTANAAIQTWTGTAIASEIQTKALASVYRQWLFHKATRQPRLRDMLAGTSGAFDDTLLNLKVGDDYVVVSQSESYIRNVGRDFSFPRS